MKPKDKNNKKNINVSEKKLVYILNVFKKSISNNIHEVDLKSIGREDNSVNTLKKLNADIVYCR